MNKKQNRYTWSWC